MGEKGSVKMNDAQTIYRWKLCQERAAELGMIVSTNGASLHAQGDPNKKKAFKAYYTAETVDAMLGFLEGAIRMRKADA